MNESHGTKRKRYELNCGHGRLIAIGSDEELYATESGSAICLKCREYDAIVGWVPPTETVTDEEL